MQIHEPPHWCLTAIVNRIPCLFTFFLSRCARWAWMGMAIDMEILCLTKRTWMFSMLLFLVPLFFFHFFVISRALHQSRSNQIVSHVKNSGKMTKFKIETNDPVCVRLTFLRTPHTKSHQIFKFQVLYVYLRVFVCMDDKMEKRIPCALHFITYFSIHYYLWMLFWRLFVAHCTERA